VLPIFWICVGTTYNVRRASTSISTRIYQKVESKVTRESARLEVGGGRMERRPNKSENDVRWRECYPLFEYASAPLTNLAATGPVETIAVAIIFGSIG